MAKIAAAGFMVGLPGGFVALRCACCGKEFEAWRGVQANDEGAAKTVCSAACDATRWRAEREAEKLAEMVEALGEEMATPWDAARCPGDPSEVAKALRWRPARGKPFLTLTGESGRGKTRVGVAVLQGSYARTGVMPIVVWPGDFTSAVAEAWGEVDASTLKRRWSKTPVLMLDDIDKEKFTERAAEMLFAVLDARYRHTLPTILTLNMTGAEFAAKFPTPRTAEAAIRRITEYGEVFFP